MRYYEEPAKKLPVAAECDVLVAGSGPAGFSAAVNAARQGAKTILIENADAVGGVATVGMMSHFTGSVKSEFYEELLGRMMEKRRFPDEKAPRVTIDPEQLKQIELDMLNEAGVKLRLYTFVSGAIVEDGAIRGVILESKSGREAVMAKIVIDATGDGDVAARAGVPFSLGREEDHLMQPVTIMFKVAGVVKDPKRVRDSWNAIYQGSKNAHRIAVLEEGMSYKPISISPEQAQFLETRKFQIDEIARIFRVPPHMVGDLDKSSFSNIDQQSD